MPTANERKALWFLAVVALSGSAVRLWRADEPRTVAGVGAVEHQLRRVDSARANRPKRGDKAAKRKKVAPRAELREPRAESREHPPADGGHPALVDLDVASIDQIESLPGIGPALAKRILVYRDSVGSFGSIESLCAVRGIGPAMVEKLRPLVTFTGPRRLLSTACGEASKKSRSARVTQPDSHAKPFLTAGLRRGRFPHSGPSARP